MESDPKPPEPTGPEPITTDAPPDASARIDRLFEAGQWPDPDLIAQVAELGEAALEPLHAFVQSHPHPDEPEDEDRLFFSLVILSMISSPLSIPVLAEVIRCHPDENGDLAGSVLGDLGAVAFEPALELILEPGMTNPRRFHAVAAAKRAAGADPALWARLADTLRPLLADALERTRVYLHPPQTQDVEKESEESIDDDDTEKHADASTERKYEIEEDLAFLVSDMADLADPQSREMIDAAFAEKLVDTFIVDKGSVDESYDKDGELPRRRYDWFQHYVEQYESHLESRDAPTPRSIPLLVPPRPDPPPKPVQATLRNTGPKLGRNDPCWCGSGKKYKKCHLGMD